MRAYAAGGGGGFDGLGGGGLGCRGGNMATRKVKCALVVVISVIFAPIFLNLRVSAGVPGKLRLPQPRQRLRQTIRDHESTLGHHKKLPARK